jgi:hypothetical protein
MSASTAKREAGAGNPHRAYLASLPEEYRIMLQVRDNVFGGSWDDQLSSMRKPLGKPGYHYSERTMADIERIEEMQRYETEHKVNLSEYF